MDRATARRSPADQRPAAARAKLVRCGRGPGAERVADQRRQGRARHEPARAGPQRRRRAATSARSRTAWRSRPVPRASSESARPRSVSTTRRRRTMAQHGSDPGCRRPAGAERLDHHLAPPRGGAHFVGDVSQHAPLYQQALHEPALERDLLPLGWHVRGQSGVRRPGRRARCADPARQVGIPVACRRGIWHSMRSRPSLVDQTPCPGPAAASCCPIAGSSQTGTSRVSEWTMGDECPPIYAWAVVARLRAEPRSRVPAGRLSGSPDELRLLVVAQHGRRLAVHGRRAGHGQPAARRRRAPRPTRALGWPSSRATWRASRPSCAIRQARSATGSIAARSRERSTRHLWDEQTGFYYDLNTDGSFVAQKSY